MSTRLFHTVILVGASLGASLATTSCGGVETSSDTVDAKSDAAETNETWPGIGYVGDSGNADSESWPPIPPAHDTGSDTGSDTWPGIRPADAGSDTGTDTWPGISPVLDTGSG